MLNIINWDLKAGTVIQVIFAYTEREVQHKISFYYVLNEDKTLDPSVLGQSFQNEILEYFNSLLCSEVTWNYILLSPTTVGFFKWTSFDAFEGFDQQNQGLDTTRGLRFSLVRYNRDKPIFFSLYGLKQDLDLPTRAELSQILPWFSQGFELPYKDTAISLGFRGCSSPVQSGGDAPVTGIGLKFFSLPKNQQGPLS